MTNMQMVEAVKRLADDLDERICELNQLISARHGKDYRAECGELEAYLNIRASLPDYFGEVA